MIRQVISTRPVRLLTIEDPVEYLHPSTTALVTHRELGDKLDAETALATVQRSDSDVILFGEMRRPADMELCLELAASGQLVLTSIHASDGGAVCERVATNLGPIGRSLLAQTLQAVVTQRLIPSRHDPKVRFLAAETMIADRTIRNLIRPGGDLTRIESTLLDRRHGMDNALAELVKAGHISRQEAMRASNDTVYLDRELSG